MKLLLVIQFAYNNYITRIIKVLLFYVNYGFELKIIYSI